MIPAMEAVFRNDAYARSCSATVIEAGPEGIRLDRTVFYPTSGGQPGDSGVLIAADGSRYTIAGAVKGAALKGIAAAPRLGRKSDASGE